MDDFASKKPQKKLPIPIGVDDYKVMIQGNYLHIDKTLLIKEFWEEGAPVVLITRPRRFGKSITLSMLKYFFEKTTHSMSSLFEKSKIWKYKEFQVLQGTYPVISLSFKDVKKDTWENAYEQILGVLQKEIDRVITPIKDSLSFLHKKQYEALMNQTATFVQFGNSLEFMTNALENNYGKKVIVLIDEYDTPITYAYLNNYYSQMTEFIRDLLSAGLKGNISLHRALLTGVVRTAKDGILSGLNNPKICTMLDGDFSDKFGFTSEEVDQLLTITGYLDKKEEVNLTLNLLGIL